MAHYLGVVPAMLMKSAKPSPDDREHGLKFCIGAGVEPELHAPFEKQFGVPLIELWGVTETGGGFIASEEPRMIDTRAFGRPLGRPGFDLDVRIVDRDDRDLPVGEQGELLVRRHGTENPRAGFFVEYLKDPQATAKPGATAGFTPATSCGRTRQACCSSSIATEHYSPLWREYRGGGGRGDAARPRGGRGGRGHGRRR